MSGIWNKIKNWISRLKEMKWMRTLPVYEIERAEERYRSMAAKGWLLRRQGSLFERYRRGDPQELQYRIEYSPVKALDGILEMTEDQMEFYADCGWTLISERRGVYVFAAPAEEEPVELYSDPKEQIRMLKSVHNYIGGVGLCFVATVVGRWVADFWTDGTNILSLATLYAADWLMFFIFATLIYVIWNAAYGYYRCRLLVKRVKRGKPLHHEPGEKQSRHLPGKITKWILLSILWITVLGSAVMMIRKTEVSLPDAGAEVPYLLGEEVYDGMRSDVNIFGRDEENSVLHVAGLLAEYYHTTEYLLDGEDNFVSLDQNLYILRDERNAVALADSLLGQSVFGADGAKKLSHPAFDYVIQGRYIAVAVRGKQVISITCIASDGLEKDWMTVLDALAEKWKLEIPEYVALKPEEVEPLWPRSV